MSKLTKRLIAVFVILVLLVIIGFFKKDDILLSFNKQLDAPTKELMKDKLSTVEIKNIVFNKDDLTDFKEQIAYDDFKYDNLDYYKYFNEISEATNDLVVKKGNIYEKENVTLKMLQNFNKNNKNLEYFKYILEKGAYNVRDSILVVNPESNLTIANKDRYIYTYTPKELVNVDDVPKLDKDEYLLTEETYTSLKQLCQGIEQQYDSECGGLVLTSAYRNYSNQKKLYSTMVRQAATNKDLVNRAGCSEHQLGNTLDIQTKGVKQEDYYKSREFKWIKANAYKYGFILRYPENSKAITGIEFEPWHLRYVGKEVAKDIYTKGITLEEYHNEVYK